MNEKLKKQHLEIMKGIKINMSALENVRDLHAELTIKHMKGFDEWKYVNSVTFYSSFVGVMYDMDGICYTADELINLYLETL